MFLKNNILIFMLIQFYKYLKIYLTLSIMNKYVTFYVYDMNVCV